MIAKIQYERERSDYEIGFRATKEYATDIFKDAKEFVQLTKKYLEK